ncbi:vesicle coat protein [Calycina marina]|uniref:Vesicle coat protein n=1 Tax=Calycina marina TaxID=1763456 RepID=A0A9P7YY51_9HELO|nr:vesicle coat protein [Calycina marina]
MVTEGLAVECATCEDDMSTIRPTSSSGSNTSKSAKNIARADSSSSDNENGGEGRPGLQRNHSSKSQLALETPPESPRVKALQSGFSGNGRPRDSNFGKTYDENDKKRAIPCENCSLTLPKKTKEDPEAYSKVDVTRPILRTRKPYAKIAQFVPAEGPSPPNSNPSNSSSDSDTATHSHARRHCRANSRSMNRTVTSPSETSFTSRISHAHYLDYTSTHESQLPTSFSIIRQSCLRTLSCETLPPSSTTTSLPSPLLASAASANATSSGGPIFFGDPVAGYTTAYIFRIPDPNARGRRRVYALMALSPHREKIAIQALGFLSAAFAQLAAWIQKLAEEELERTESVLSPRMEEGERGSHITPTSSFLSGRSRASAGDGKFAGMSLRSKGLAELVGMPDFFFELHKRFVTLLIELGMAMS